MSHIFNYNSDSSPESSPNLSPNNDVHVDFMDTSLISIAPASSIQHQITPQSEQPNQTTQQHNPIQKPKRVQLTKLDHLDFEEQYNQSRIKRKHQQDPVDSSLLSDHSGDEEEKGVKKPSRRFRTNLDAESDAFTGSWGQYDGEAELKAKVQQMRQAQQEEKIILKQEQQSVTETSIFHLPCLDQYKTTKSSSDIYVDFNYNTNDYCQQVYHYQQEYKDNQPLTPDDAKIQRKEYNDSKTFKSSSDPSQSTTERDETNEDINDTLPRYDQYDDILLSIAFKSSTRRSFLDPPPAFKLSRTPLYGTPNFTCRLPSKSVHSFRPSTKGVNCVRFFPITGQYIISAGSDGCVKLYSTSGSTLGKSGCVREYIGHASGIRDVQWVDDGKRFLTASYDGWVKLWDTETGKVLFRHRTTRGNRSHATPMCIAADHDEVMVGCGDGHLYGYDMRSGEACIQYDQLQASITTMIDVPGAPHRRIFTASADGKCVVYEWGIPSVVQHVTQHTREMLTRACVHPSNNFILANTHDNSASIFRVENGHVRMNRKKKFDGHLTAGYTLGLCCSPDGCYVASGDGSGHIVCWDWKSGRMVWKKKAHSEACIDVEWQFNSPSTIVSASWNGEVTVWK